MPVQSVTFSGKRYVVLPEVEYRRLAGEPPEPLMPKPDAQGNYPALETMRAILARKILRRRRALGLTQSELAERAGIRPETLNRIERTKRPPSVATVDRIDAALQQAEAEDTGERREEG